MPSNPWQIERAYERAAEELADRHEHGELSDAEYNEAMCELDRDARDEYEQARAEGDGDYAGLAVLFYPQVCSRCKTPYREGPVMREVD